MGRDVGRNWEKWREEKKSWSEYIMWEKHLFSIKGKNTGLPCPWILRFSSLTGENLHHFPLRLDEHSLHTCMQLPTPMLARCPHLCFDQHFWMWQLPGTFSVFTPPLSHTLPHAMYLPSSWVRLSLLNSGHLLISPWGWGGVALWLGAGDAFKNQLRQPEFFLWDLCYSWLDQVWCLVTGKWLAYILSHSSFWLKIIFFN